MNDLVQWLENEKKNKVVVVGRDLPMLDANRIKSIASSCDAGERVFLLVENALGIRNFAGAFPKGETNYFVPVLGLKTEHAYYTKAQVQNLLEAAGVAGKFYYPYPDEMHTEFLFTDERGPKADDVLPKNLRYDEREFNLFSESDMAQRLSEEGCFGTFANVFLVELNPKTDISYEKFSDNRKKEFAIRTVLGKDSDGRYALKEPLFPEGKDYISCLISMEEKLDAACKNAGFRVCRGVATENGIKYPFIEGKNYDAICDEALLSDGQDACVNKIKAFIEDVKQIEQRDGVFVITDVDLLMSNVILDAAGQKWIIDAEWTFENIEYSVDYLVYRILRYYLYAKEYRMQALGEKIFDIFGIDVASREAFDKIEEKFLAYTSGVEESFGVEVYDKRNAHEILLDAQNSRYSEPVDLRVCVYYDFGNGFSEENKLTFPGEQVQCEGLDLELPKGLVGLRIDPAQAPGVLKLAKIYDEAGRDNKYYHGGILVSEDQVYFDSEDPNFVVDLHENQKRVHVEFSYAALFSYAGSEAFSDAFKESKFAKLKSKIRK